MSVNSNFAEAFQEAFFDNLRPSTPVSAAAAHTCVKTNANEGQYCVLGLGDCLDDEQVNNWDLSPPVAAPAGGDDLGAKETSWKYFSFAEWFLRCLIAAELPIFLDEDGCEVYEVGYQLLEKYKKFKGSKPFVNAWLHVQPKTHLHSQLSKELARMFIANGSDHDAEMSKLLYESRPGVNLSADAGPTGTSRPGVNLSADADARRELLLRAAGLDSVQQLEQITLLREKEDEFTGVTHIAALRHLETDPNRNSDKSDAFRTFLESLGANAKVLFVGDVDKYDTLIKKVPANQKLHYKNLKDHLELPTDEELITHCDFQLQLRFYMALKRKLPNVTVVGTQSGLLDVIGIAMGVSTIRFTPNTFDKTRTRHIQGAYGLPVEWRDF